MWENEGRIGNKKIKKNCSIKPLEIPIVALYGIIRHVFRYTEKMRNYMMPSNFSNLTIRYKT